VVCFPPPSSFFIRTRTGITSISSHRSTTPSAQAATSPDQSTTAPTSSCTAQLNGSEATAQQLAA
jgi:hypothetical protein